MKIGISCHATAGGSGILATELGIALAERGHEVHFVTEEPLFRLQTFQERVVCHHADKVTYPVFNSPPYTLALASKISEIAEEYGIELWHTHYAVPYAACALIARDMLSAETHFKLVTTLHGTDITLVGSDPSFFRMTKFAMEQSDAVTAVSTWLAEETQKTFHLSREVKTIYNFFNEERFQADCGEGPRLAPDGVKVIMHISNFRPVKRVTDVVRVFKKILDAVPARLFMVGEGPERVSAVAVARQLGIAEHIKYLGIYKDIECLLPHANLVIQPSEHESFGLVPLEAMVCGVPVIGTASGGICEVVEHGVSGYLCEVGDTDTMAACAVEVLTDPEKAREMGARGRERAYRLFSRDRIVDQYEALYREVLAR